MSGLGNSSGKKRPATSAADDGSSNRRQKTNRRRRPIDPSSLPRFLDSTGAVTAGTFAARRLPEMKSLWRSFLSTKHAKSDAVTFSNVGGGLAPITGAAAPITDDAALYRSGGRKTSDRHLRRRTGSHSRRRRHRYPTGDVRPQLEGASTDDQMKTNQSGDMVVTIGKRPNEQDKKPCRRARRKRGTLREAHRHWQVTSPVEMSALSSLKQNDPSATSTIPSKWLETHLWHTKRFHMGNLFGWSVPLVHTGRGTAAALRLAQTNCTVQDATWSIDGGAVVLCAPSMEALCATLGKICGEQAKTLQDKMVLSGMRWGEGMVHQPGAYPLGVIGPARFLFYRQEKKGNSGNGEEYHVAIFVHPATRGKLYEALSSVAGAGDCECNLDHIVGGLSLIQVRGINALNAIRSALRPTSKKDNAMSWNQVSQSSQAHTILPHGAVLPVKLSPKLSTTSTPQTCENVDVDKANQIKEDIITHIAKVNDGELLDLVPSISGIGRNTFAALISHRSKNGASRGCHNTASCGWDILCSPSMANEIFLCLNNNGGACAIGLAEEASAALEAEPPIAVFPRDFPDTETGEAYWSGRNSEWNIVRCCLENGAQGGRFKTELKRTLKTQILNTSTGGISYQPIDWSSIADRKVKTAEEAVVDSDGNDGIVSSGVEVVRGTFGVPFAQALAGSGRFTAKEQGASSSKSDGKKRRPRRHVRPPNVAVNAEPLEDEEADAHENMCQMLLSSLSLPALLRCHILVEGQGNLTAGATIFEYNKEAATQENNPNLCTILGYVVAGAFSSNRGQCHGPGFVGAAKLLQNLIENEHANTASVTSQGGGDRSVALRVLVQNAADGSAMRSATLQLML